MRLALVAALALLGGAQEEPTIEEEIAALVERTNALESLRLVYDCVSDEGPGTIEVFYRAPDRARIRGAFGGEEFDSWVVASTAYFCLEGKWRRVEFAETSEARRLLDALFPDRDEALPPGVSVWLASGPDPTAEGEFRYEMTFGWFARGREFVLGWAPLRDPAGCTRDGETIVLEREGLTHRIARATGMLQSVEARAKPSPTLLRLRECEIDDETGAAALEPPADAKAAPLDQAWTDLQFTWGWKADRETGFARFARARTESPLDERWLEDWRAFLATLHRDFLRKRLGKRLDELRPRLEAPADRIREALGRDPFLDRARLRRESEEERAKIERKLGEVSQSVIASLPPLPRDDDGRPELLAAEVEVVGEVVRELLVAPALAVFDEAIEEALRN